VTLHSPLALLAAWLAALFMSGGHVRTLICVITAGCTGLLYGRLLSSKLEPKASSEDER